MKQIWNRIYEDNLKMRYYQCDHCDFITLSHDKYTLSQSHQVDFGVDIDDFEDNDYNVVHFLGEHKF